MPDLTGARPIQPPTSSSSTAPTATEYGQKLRKQCAGTANIYSEQAFFAEPQYNLLPYEIFNPAGTLCCLQKIALYHTRLSGGFPYGHTQYALCRAVRHHQPHRTADSVAGHALRFLIGQEHKSPNLPNCAKRRNHHEPPFHAARPDLPNPRQHLLSGCPSLQSILL